MAKKYEIPEYKPQMVSEPPVGEACVAIDRPVMSIVGNDDFDLTRDQVNQILEMSDKAFSKGQVYTHAEVMNRLRNYEYGRSLV